MNDKPAIQVESLIQRIIMEFKTVNLMWAHAHMLGYKYAAFNKDKTCFGFKGKPYIINSKEIAPEVYTIIHLYWVYPGEHILLGKYVGDETNWKNSLN